MTIFTATDALFTLDDNTGTPYKPINNTIECNQNYENKTYGKSIWKVIDEDLNEYAVIFPGIQCSQSGSFVKQLNGSVYTQTSNEKSVDLTSKMTIIGDNSECIKFIMTVDK